MPENVFEAGERTARVMALSRSAPYMRAVAEFVARHDPARVTAILDAVYAESEAALDTDLAALQYLSLPVEKW